jgi:hypothetical protein
MTTPFSLSDEELDRLMAAASMLPQQQRDSFVRSVAGRVAGLPCVSMAEIESAIAFVLNSYGVAPGNNAVPRNNSRSRYAKGVFK